MKKINNLFNLFDVRHTRIVPLFCMMAVLLCCIQFTAPAITYSPDSTVVTATEGDSASVGSGSNWADAGVSIANDIQKDFVKLSMAIVPTLFVVALLVLGFCKDPRAASAIVRWLVIIILIAIGILLVNKGTLMNIIKDFVDRI